MEAAIEELRQCANRLVEQGHDVLAVALFGSLARSESTPSSDADILIILANHEAQRWFDRILQYTEPLRMASLSVEPFPFLAREARNMLKCTGFKRTAIRESITLAGDTEIISEYKKFCQ